jgi:hypothetical protein
VDADKCRKRKQIQQDSRHGENRSKIRQVILVSRSRLAFSGIDKIISPESATYHIPDTVLGPLRASSSSTCPRAGLFWGVGPSRTISSVDGNYSWAGWRCLEAEQETSIGSDMKGKYLWPTSQDPSNSGGTKSIASCLVSRA